VNVVLIDRKNIEIQGKILVASKKSLKSLKDWNFNWLELYSTHSTIYKLQIEKEIIGLAKLDWENEDHFNLANVEVSPDNVGSKGQYKNAADLLFAYSALQSFKLNKNAYKGFLSFISKGKLISHYIEKYNAELVFRERMIISPKNCKALIEEQLKIKL
jgi:hypothetical protein